MRRLLMFAFGLFVFANTSVAEEPKYELLPYPKGVAEVLPPAIAVVEMGPLGPVKPGYFQPSQLAHWQLYGIDHQGQFKPRVILAPQPYYLYNGKPYGFLQVRPLDLTPYSVPR